MQTKKNEWGISFLLIALELYRSNQLDTVINPQSIFPEREGNIWDEINAELRTAQAKHKGLET